MEWQQLPHLVQPLPILAALLDWHLQQPNSRPDVASNGTGQAGWLTALTCQLRLMTTAILKANKFWQTAIQQQKQLQLQQQRRLKQQMQAEGRPFPPSLAAEPAAGQSGHTEWPQHWLELQVTLQTAEVKEVVSFLAAPVPGSTCIQ
jgi:hypothetical protein